MTGWEYLVVNLEGSAGEEAHTLDGYGEAGWELVGVCVRGYEVRAYFKRPVTP